MAASATRELSLDMMSCTENDDPFGGQMEWQKNKNHNKKKNDGAWLLEATKKFWNAIAAQASLWNVRL